MPLRNVFFNRVRDVLYGRLRNQYLKGWDINQIIGFTDAVIEENRSKIDDYLDTRKITLNNINEAVEDVVQNILIPSIRV